MKSCLILLFMLAANLAFAQNTGNNNEAALIQSYRSASNQAIARHDIESMAKYWLDDFVQVRGNGTYAMGKPNVIAIWKELFSKTPEVSYIRNPDEIIISDNDTMAWEKGHWIGINSYSKGGNYAAMWLKVNGAWMLKTELFVSLKE